MLAGYVQDLLALLGRQTAPDVPRCQSDTDGPETSAEAWHETILAQALRSAPFVLVVAVAVVVVVALVFLALGLR